MNGCKLHDLFKLEEINEEKSSGIEFSLSPGEMKIFLVCPPTEFVTIKERILNKKLRESIFNLKLRMKPFLLNGNAYFFEKELTRIGDLLKDDLTSDRLEECFEKFSDVQKSFERAMIENKEFKSFSERFKEVDDKLTRIDEYIKAHKYLKEKISEKESRRLGLKRNSDWETSPEVETIDAKFSGLAKRYLQIKTAFLRAEWKNFEKELDALNNDASDAVKQIESR
ncbi:hypothetical protein HYY75_10490 [bacterium]|nr:hypothetical protein [bacterium]